MSINSIGIIASIIKVVDGKIGNTGVYNVSNKIKIIISKENETTIKLSLDGKSCIKESGNPDFKGFINISINGKVEDTKNLMQFIKDINLINSVRNLNK